MYKTPILFLIFNRPEATEKVFNEIKKQKPKTLFIAADGPRNYKNNEEDLCVKTRNIVLNNIDWDCDVKTLLREDNLGCGKAVSQAIKWFFENVEEGIILEDDCLPNESFFYFMQLMIDKYRNNPKVGIISGCNFINNKLRINETFYFSKYAYIWGWATWKEKIENYDFKISDWKSNWFDEQYYNFNLKEIEFWKKNFNEILEDNIDTWDFQLQWLCWKEKYINIVPSKNLIKNIGFNNLATHTKNNDIWFANLKTYKIKKIIFPTQQKINDQADSLSFNNINEGFLQFENNQKTIRDKFYLIRIKIKEFIKTTIKLKLCSIFY
jgi:hypothetical protein